MVRRAAHTVEQVEELRVQTAWEPHQGKAVRRPQEAQLATSVKVRAVSREVSLRAAREVAAEVQAEAVVDITAVEVVTATTQLQVVVAVAL